MVSELRPYGPRFIGYTKINPRRSVSRLELDPAAMRDLGVNLASVERDIGGVDGAPARAPAKLVAA